MQRTVKRLRRRAASAMVHCAPAARGRRHRAAAQRERYISVIPDKNLVLAHLP
jgi:hypothetical protein